MQAGVTNHQAFRFQVPTCDKRRTKTVQRSQFGAYAPRRDRRTALQRVGDKIRYYFPCFGSAPDR